MRKTPQALIRDGLDDIVEICDYVDGAIGLPGIRFIATPELSFAFNPTTNEVISASMRGDIDEYTPRIPVTREAVDKLIADLTKLREVLE